jgi:hypothetical protein
MMEQARASMQTSSVFAIFWVIYTYLIHTRKSVTLYKALLVRRHRYRGDLRSHTLNVVSYPPVTSVLPSPVIASDQIFLL